jgi:hypothetical protein
LTSVRKPHRPLFPDKERILRTAAASFNGRQDFLINDERWWRLIGSKRQLEVVDDPVRIFIIAKVENG